MTDIIINDSEAKPEHEDFGEFHEHVGKGEGRILSLAEAGQLEPAAIPQPKMSPAAFKAYRFRVAEGVIGGAQAEVTKALNMVASVDPDVERKLSLEARIRGTAAIVWEEVNKVYDLCPSQPVGLKHFTHRHRTVIKVARMMRDWMKIHQNAIVTKGERHPAVLAFMRATAHYVGCVYAIMREQDSSKRNLHLSNFRTKLGDII